MPSIVLHYVIIAGITVMFVLVNKFYGTKVIFRDHREHQL